MDEAWDEVGWGLVLVVVGFEGVVDYLGVCLVMCDDQKDALSTLLILSLLF